MCKTIFFIQIFIQKNKKKYWKNLEISKERIYYCAIIKNNDTKKIKNYKMQHTKGNWSVNHWSKCESGVRCISMDKDGVNYYQGDAVDSPYYNIVSKIDPMSHFVQASFEGAHIARIEAFGHQDGGKESLANAKLIASAPRLLDAILQIKNLADQAMCSHELDTEKILAICQLATQNIDLSKSEIAGTSPYDDDFLSFL